MKKLIIAVLAFALSSQVFAEQQEQTKLINIKTAPLSYLVGIRNIEVDVAAFDHWTVGGFYYNWQFTFDNSDYTVDGWGLRTNYFFNRALTGGFYLTGQAAFSGIDAEDDRFLADQNQNVKVSADASFNTYTALAGYQFSWDYFNISLALGASYFTLPGEIKGESNGQSYKFDTTLLSGIVPNGELMFGVAF